MGNELRQCPFCGTIAVSSTFSIDVYNWYEENVHCEECRCSIAHPQAITIWNTRPAEDALQAEIERLKEALKGMCELWDALGGQVPPVLGEQKYIRAKNLLNVPCTNKESDDKDEETSIFQTEEKGKAK